ncbi:MAG: flavodoxin family protein, partial [Cyanobacteria bacterium RUI128]|nr:flavodoxin family protein [Cyanobacteria bacterium RUI128]
NGNSDTLCDAFMKGAQESGHEVEKIFIASKNIGFCHGCNFCQRNNGVCAIKDDMSEILEKMIASDVLLLSSPIYFYSINAQMKALIDRSVARWLEIKNKEMYYIMTGAEDSTTVIDIALECFRGFASCLEGSQERGYICGKGVYEKGEIEQTPFVQQAYEMGKMV